MDYKFYKCQHPISKDVVDYGIVKRNILEENVESLLYFPWNNNTRPFYMYKKTNYGLSKLIDGEKPRFYIYMGDEASKILRQICLLEKIYEPDDLLFALQKFPHIAYTCFEGMYPWDDIENKYFAEFKKRNKAYFIDDFIFYSHRFHDNTRYCDDDNRFFIRLGNNDKFDGVFQLNTMLKFADNLLYELKHFRLDLSKLKYNESYLNYKNSSVDPKLKKIIAIGGLFVARALVKSIGADFNTSFDFDIPDTNFDYTQLDSPDLELYNGHDIDVDTDYTPEAYAGLEDQYNISFGAQKETLQRSGGGLGSLDVTITKEPGSSNLFCITDGSNTIHNVKGGTSSIKIDGITYKLPKLKG